MPNMGPRLDGKPVFEAGMSYPAPFSVSTIGFQLQKYILSGASPPLPTPTEQAEGLRHSSRRPVSAFPLAPSAQVHEGSCDPGHTCFILLGSEGEDQGQAWLREAGPVAWGEDLAVSALGEEGPRE